MGKNLCARVKYYGIHTPAGCSRYINTHAGIPRSNGTFYLLFSENPQRYRVYSNKLKQMTAEGLFSTYARFLVSLNSYQYSVLLIIKAG